MQTTITAPAYQQTQTLFPIQIVELNRKCPCIPLLMHQILMKNMKLKKEEKKERKKEFNLYVYLNAMRSLDIFLFSFFFFFHKKKNSPFRNAYNCTLYIQWMFNAFSLSFLHSSVYNVMQATCNQVIKLSIFTLSFLSVQCVARLLILMLGLLPFEETRMHECVARLCIQSLCTMFILYTERKECWVPVNVFIQFSLIYLCIQYYHLYIKHYTYTYRIQRIKWSRKTDEEIWNKVSIFVRASSKITKTLYATENILCIECIHSNTNHRWVLQCSWCVEVYASVCMCFLTDNIECIYVKNDALYSSFDGSTSHSMHLFLNMKNWDWRIDWNSIVHDEEMNWRWDVNSVTHRLEFTFWNALNWELRMVWRFHFLSFFVLFLICIFFVFVFFSFV